MLINFMSRFSVPSSPVKTRERNYMEIKPAFIYQYKFYFSFVVLF